MPHTTYITSSPYGCTHGTSSMAFLCSVSGRTICSAFKTNLLPLTVNSLNIWLNLLDSFHIIDMPSFVMAAATFLSMLSSLVSSHVVVLIDLFRTLSWKCKQ